ncbi:unnamed protein product [Musa textilis]
MIIVGHCSDSKHGCQIILLTCMFTSPPSLAMAPESVKTREDLNKWHWDDQLLWIFTSNGERGKGTPWGNIWSQSMRYSWGTYSFLSFFSDPASLVCWHNLAHWF